MTKISSEYIEQVAKVGFWEYDVKTKKTLWSEEMYQILGLKNKQSLRKLIHPDDLNIYKENLRNLLGNKPNVDGTIRIKRQDGKIIHTYFKARFIKNKIAGTLQDVTNVIGMQEDLEKAKEKAEELNIAKSYFLAQASHDLRQPMQALKIFIHNLLSEDLTKSQLKIAKQIEASTNNLNSLLDSLLDMSKIEAGGFTNSREKFFIDVLLQNMADEFYELADIKNIKLKMAGCHVEIVSDPLLIERILRNFISNALKYTKDVVLLTCRKFGDTVKISVYDNGVGISEKDIPYIFDEFYQSDRIERNQKNGAGLGLSIVKKIASIINGEISVKSTPKKGSRFTLTLKI